MTERKKANERGIVLVLVVIVITIISTIVVDFIFNTQVNYEISANSLSEMKAHYIAKSGVSVLSGTFINKDIEELAAAGRSIEGIMVENQEQWSFKIPMFPVGDGNVTIVVEDERGKLNLNSLVNSSTNRIDFQMLTALTELFRYLGVEDSKIQLFIASLINWLDRPLEGAQNNQDPRGADSSYYEGLENPYIIKDGPLDTVAEIKLIHGMDSEFFNKVRDYVTVYAGDKQVNFSTASKPVMIAVLKAASVSAIRENQDNNQTMDDSVAERIADNVIEMRVNDPVIDRKEVRNIVRDMDAGSGSSAGITGLVLNSGTSEVFTIKSTGFIGETDPVIGYVEAVVEKKRVGRSSEIDIISWKQR